MVFDVKVHDPAKLWQALYRVRKVEDIKAPAFNQFNDDQNLKKQKISSSKKIALKNNKKLILKGSKPHGCGEKLYILV